MRIFYTLILLFVSLHLKAQTETSFNWAVLPDCVYVTQPLRDIPIITDLFPNEDKPHVYPIKMRRNKFTNENALPDGNDPLWQDEMGILPNRGPIENWEGIDNNLGFPPDPSGAAGPNHYVQMVNSRIEIFDKQGNSLVGPNALSSVLSSNNGDPIVLYDKFADRWFLSGFGQGNSLSFAMSNTPDPAGSYTVWNYNLSSFPDYPKYGLWHDGYYVTANTGGPDCYVLERDEMLLGASGNPQFISMSIPGLNTGAGTQTGGFRSVIPAFADFALPPASEKLNLFYFQDDAWNNVTQDEIKIWEVTVDWNVPSNSSISAVQNLAVAPFDSQFNVNWNDITQPGTNQKLDGIPGAFMYRAQYTDWTAHQTVMLNHTVDVNGTNQAGIRWYELRKTGTLWTVHQQSTYSPDNQSRWMGSISMDNQGNIGLAYALSSSTTFPSIMFTGRYATDALNMMTLAEDTIVLGGSSQFGGNRYGDYAHMSVDPVDDQTFWYTCEYMDNSSRSTRIASFKLATNNTDDIGVTALPSPTDGLLTATENISIEVKNFGLNDQNNFSVGYQIDNNPPVIETYTAGPLTPNSLDVFTFTQTADLSTIGAYSIKFFTGLATDQNLLNDTATQIVYHLQPNDVGITVINSPSTNNNMSMETISVTIENFGTAPQSNFDLAYQINNGTPVVETFTGTIAAGANTVYNFSTQGDFTNFGIYDIVVFTALASDNNQSNDTLATAVENSNCAPTSNCQFGDGITQFQLGTINNPSGCTPGGYSDYTSISTDLLVGYSHNVSISSAFSPQYVTMWIDYNDNFFFESSEKVISAFQFSNTGTTAFAIDANEPLGMHLIRVKAADNANDTGDPCADFTYGETQDYSVELISDLSIGDNGSSRKIIISTVGESTYLLNASHFETKAVVKIHNSLGQLIFETIAEKSDLAAIKIDLKKFATGPYLIHVQNSENSEIIKVIK
ncbi:MAG: GEVED domain-containing protein [Putridiphycobacter sp.]|nr:GEVED domain-containing protein [Putridiphycobacter sp.]